MSRPSMTTTMSRRTALTSLIAGGVSVALCPLPAGAARADGGGMVLQFDDGWSNWVDVIAPEIKKAGGTATGFVCNQYIQSGRISIKQLLQLQNDFGWEIGSHAYHHLNAPSYVRRKGLAHWVEHELEASLNELREASLDVRSIVLPFNAVDEEIAEALKGKVETFRRATDLALASGPAPDGSLPGTSIDIIRYTPLSQIRMWVNFAKRKKQYLLLYGHRILPDDQFVTGTVKAVSATTLTIEEPIAPLPKSELAYVLVPDTKRRTGQKHRASVASIKDNVIHVEGATLTGATSAGATFMIGPSYGTRLSDFRDIITYAANHLTFYTLHQVFTRSQTP